MAARAEIRNPNAAEAHLLDTIYDGSEVDRWEKRHRLIEIPPASP
jgi:hypothetical protein